MADPTYAPEPSRVATLPAAMLLACSGGLLDAVVYVGHGHVFVTAMTGNVVLLAIAASSRDWGQTLRHVDVLGGFVMGLAASELIRERPPHLAGRFTLALEIVAIAGMALFSGSMPMLVLLATLAFVSAFQIATFRRVGRFSYNSTFLTANIRDFVEAVVDRRVAADAGERAYASAKAMDLGLICAAFVVGALAGAWLQWLLPRYSLWFAEVPLLPVMGIALWRRAGAEVPAAQ